MSTTQDDDDGFPTTSELSYDQPGESPAPMRAPNTRRLWLGAAAILVAVLLLIYLLTR
jgi:hypothetical protein